MADSTKVQTPAPSKQKKRKTIQYDRWGYFFIAPFFLIFFIFSLIPLVTTFVYSFFENYRDGLNQIGPNATVPKYFTGTEEAFGWQLKSTQKGIDELIVTYNGKTATPELADEVMNYLAPAVISYDKVGLIVSKRIKANDTIPEVFAAVKKSLSSEEWAMEGLDILCGTFSNSQFTNELSSEISSAIITFLEENTPEEKRIVKADAKASKYRLLDSDYSDSNFRRPLFGKKVMSIVKNGINKNQSTTEILEIVKENLTKREPAFVRNFQNVFASGDNIARYFLNTLIMWIIGFLPQILVSLILAVWFTNTELKLKFQQFFKTVIYMPNLIMASAFAMLFFTLFSPNGPIESIIRDIRAFNEAKELSKIITGILSVENLEAVKLWFASNTDSTASLVDLINSGVIPLEDMNLSREALVGLLNNHAISFSCAGDVVSLLEKKSLFFSSEDAMNAVRAYLGTGNPIPTNNCLTYVGMVNCKASDFMTWIANGNVSSMAGSWSSEFVEGMKQNIDPIRFFASVGWSRVLVGVMNFLMWYGNTTILLMAGIMGIDNSLFEAARIDGASPLQTFFKITIPLLLPIFVYVMITSLIGGIQMFDVPQILTKGAGNPNRTTMTIIMKLNNYLQVSKNYGNSGIMSILIFAVTGVLSGIVYKMTMAQYRQK